MKIDGKLDEDIWKQAKRYKDFYKINSTNLSEIQTEALLNWDNENLYFAFICSEPNIDKIKNQVRENSLKVYSDDSVEIMLDTDGNKADYYHFIFNPSGYYGVEHRTQGGFVGGQIKDFELHTGTNIEKDRWLIEIVIPLASLGLEVVENDILVNFARNRRLDLEQRQESTTGKQGEYHNPYAFIQVHLKDIDVSFYRVKADPVKITQVKLEDNKFVVSAQTKVKNFSNKQRKIEITYLEPTLGIIDKSEIEIEPEREKEIRFDFKVPVEKEYKLTALLKEGGKQVFNSTNSIKIEYIPLSIELVKPFYRNSIYSTQKIDEIELKINLNTDKIQNPTGTVGIKNKEGKEIINLNFTPLSENIIKIKIGNIEEGEYEIIVRVYESGKIKFENSIPLYKLPPGKGNEVYIDENLNLILNGKPILPLIWWAGSPPEEIAKTGADGIICDMSQLDELQKIGQLGVVMLLWGRERGKYFEGKESLSEEAIKVITQKVNSIKNHPALLFYYLVDEPEVRSISPKVLKEAYELIKKIDPYHPINITNDTVAGIRTYIDCADLFYPDPYICPLVDGRLARPMSYLIPFLNQIKVSAKNRKFVAITPGVFDYGKVYAQNPPYDTRNNRAPSFVEVRCYNYLAIVYGAKGFNYYVYGKKDPKHWGAVNYPDLIVGMPYLIKEKKSLADIILLGKEKNNLVTLNDKDIHYLVKEYKGKKFIICTNIECKNTEVKVSIPEEIAKLKVISEKRQIPVKNGRFKDIFGPYEVHIYTDDLSFPEVINLKKVEEYIKKEGGWYNYPYKKVK